MFHLVSTPQSDGKHVMNMKYNLRGLLHWITLHWNAWASDYQWFSTLFIWRISKKHHHPSPATPAPSNSSPQKISSAPPTSWGLWFLPKSLQEVPISMSNVYGEKKKKTLIKLRTISYKANSAHQGRFFYFDIQPANTCWESLEAIGLCLCLSTFLHLNEKKKPKRKKKK